MEEIFFSRVRFFSKRNVQNSVKTILFIGFWWNLNLTLILMQFASNIKRRTSSWIFWEFFFKDWKKLKNSIFFVRGNFYLPHEFTPYWYKRMYGKKLHGKLPLYSWLRYKPTQHLDQPYHSKNTLMIYGTKNLSPIF